jgi:hypothetical protein
MLQTDVWSSASDPLFFFFFSSLLLDFCIDLAIKATIHFVISLYLFYVLFITIWFIRYDLWNWICFQYHPPSIFFYHSYLILILLIDIYFIWDDFLKSLFFFYYFIPFKFFSTNLILIIRDWSFFSRFHAPIFNLLEIELLDWIRA